MNKSGFTLMELIVVLFILTLIGHRIIPKLLERPEQAKILKAKQDIHTLMAALELYRLDNGNYPSTAQGLSALVKRPKISPKPLFWQSGGYLSELPNDPWNEPYHYHYQEKPLTVKVSSRMLNLKEKTYGTPAF